MNPHDTRAVNALAKSLEAYCTSAVQQGMSVEQLQWSLTWLADLLVMWAADSTALSSQERAVVLAHAASVYAAAGVWQEVASVLEGIIPMLPEADQPKALVQQSSALNELGRPADALVLAERAIRLVPDNIPVRWNYARRLADAGRFAEAEFEYTSLLQQAARDPLAAHRMQTELDRIRARRPDTGKGAS